MKPNVIVRSLVILSTSVIAGCSAKVADQVANIASPRHVATEVATPGIVTKTYALKGVVRSVARETRRLMIRHEAIPGFMAAMTMPFEIKNQKILDVVRPGDTVQGVLRVEWRDGAVEDYELVDLAVTASSPPNRSADKSKANQVSESGNRLLEPGDLVPDFMMIGQDGKSLRLSDLKGKVVVITFIYTRCPLPDFCPRMDQKFSELSQHIASFPGRARAIRLISLSFDPEHDTPEVLTKHGKIRGAKPPLWSYAVASHDELAKVAPSLGLTYGPLKDEVLHNLCTAVIGPDGKLARLAVGTQSNKWDTTDFLKSIYSLIPKPEK